MKTKSPSKLGKINTYKIRAYLSYKGKTLQNLADYLGLSKQHISAMLKGRRSIAHHMDEIAAYLGQSIKELSVTTDRPLQPEKEKNNASRTPRDTHTPKSGRSAHRPARTKTR